VAILGARFFDRIGKGIRDAPRDALIADVTAAEVRGAAYGLRQALDSVGAFVGPLLAIALMALYANDFRAVFWWAVVPASLAVLLIVFGVWEPTSAKLSDKRSWPIVRMELARLPYAYWYVTLLGVVFALARFSEAFLVLKAQSAGLALALIPLVYIWMNLVYSAVSAPAGALSDSIGRRRLLLFGLFTLATADVVLGFAPGIFGVFLGVGLWGLYLGLTQGLLSALVADTAPEELRGTAFGVFNLLTGVALLIASAFAGWLWNTFGPTTTFVAGAMFSGIACVVLMFRRSRWHGP